eukprot:4289607-Heterocapsa_arctica.AAC.1
MRLNILVRADWRPALGSRQRRAHSLVDTRPLCRLSVCALPIARASSQGSTNVNTLARDLGAKHQRGVSVKSDGVLRLFTASAPPPSWR